MDRVNETHDKGSGVKLRTNSTVIKIFSLLVARGYLVNSSK